MAELKNLLVNGPARVNGDLYANLIGSIDGYKIEVVSSIPSQPDAHTIYILK